MNVLQAVEAQALATRWKLYDTLGLVEDLRVGWRKWCWLQPLETCEIGAERDGWQAAANANDRGGQRPKASDSLGMTVADFAAEVGS